MNKQVLQMTYHPAKKEVGFRRFQNGQEIAIRNDSKLMDYMNAKGTFVLQDHGNEFFDDIAVAFDGLKHIEMQVITTKIDYEDFEQMVEFYNSEPGKCKINPTLLGELPDMVQTFAEVQQYGKEAVEILEAHRQKLFEIPLGNESVRQSAENFAKQIDQEVDNIKEKIKSLSDNSVSLCFTGVYSSGKSALINAILGYRILPEDIKSETAKMFQISSPKEGENVKIKFEICRILSELEWNEDGEYFEFSNGPLENPIRTEIQEVLNTIREEGKKKHEQIKCILSKLNEKEEVSSHIKLFFPISLDTNNVQFTIYDTPGTDSNDESHQHVLNEALEKQTQSILIFVAKPDGLEGSGNNALLNYLKVAEENSTKTSIDIGRSLFVINKADGQTADARMTLQKQQIKNKDNDSFSIKLADKKLFFTSAIYGYAAKAMKNGIATEQDHGLFQAGKYTVALEQNPMGYCYRQNRCATSEYATGKMIDRCEMALKEAQEKNDDKKILSICSGLYALESEIVQYGEKYASAVKAFAIIDSVDRALTKLNNQANSLKGMNTERIEKIQEDIDELSGEISQEIEDEYEDIISKVFEKERIKQLKLDSETLNNSLVGGTKKRIDKKLKGRFFGIGEVKVKDKHKNQVKNLINQAIQDFTKSFLSERQILLEKQRDDFMNKVKSIIKKNGDISESAKEYFLDIPQPEITKPNIFKDVENIYNTHRITKGIFFTKEYLNKEGFIKDVEEKLAKVAGAMRDDYSADYSESLQKILNQIRSQFIIKLDQYSLHIKAMFENKQAMQQLGDRLSDAANDLNKCKNKLDGIIWKENKNA